MQLFNPIHSKWVVATPARTDSLIVTTINPIWCSHPVHPGTKKVTICSHKIKENIIFAHNFIFKQNTNQASHCFDFYLSIVFLVKGLDTSNQL